MGGAGVAINWDGRDHSPWGYAASGTAAFGPWRAGGGVGKTASIRPFEIAIAGPATKIAVDPAEMVDFLLGWFFLDIMKDDYGWSS